MLAPYLLKGGYKEGVREKLEGEIPGGTGPIAYTEMSPLLRLGRERLIQGLGKRGKKEGPPKGSPVGKNWGSSISVPAYRVGGGIYLRGVHRRLIKRRKTHVGIKNRALLEVRSRSETDDSRLREETKREDFPLLFRWWLLETSFLVS